MNLNQVLETIKNLNLTFDGKLNSETVVKIAEKIMPYFYMLQIKSVIVTIIWAIAVVISAKAIGKALLKMSGD